MEEINASIDFDKRLAGEDLAGSRAHARMLVAQGIISKSDGEAILKGLDQIASEINGGTSHSNVSSKTSISISKRGFAEIAGAAAGRLHTARSRNDQVATDFRLWVRDGLRTRRQRDSRHCSALWSRRPSAHVATIMPGFTHMQPAQPVSFGHHCLAYVEMFARDRGRFADARTRMNESPLGAAALAGTPFPIDREMTAKELGFIAPDAQFARCRFGARFRAGISRGGLICGHPFVAAGRRDRVVGVALIRLREIERCIHHRLLDHAAEAQSRRGRIGARQDRAAFWAASWRLCTVMKGLALAYAKDLQEDKEALFCAADALDLSLAAMAGMVARSDSRTLTPCAAPRKRAIRRRPILPIGSCAHSKATVPRGASHCGRIVKRAEDTGRALDKLPLGEMQKIEPAITDEVLRVSCRSKPRVNARTSFGGTAPVRVREQVAFWREKLK